MKFEYDRQLLCTFSDVRNYTPDLNTIGNFYRLANEKIFAFCNEEDETEIYLTYQIIKSSSDDRYPRTISVHRKKETNTIYTLNAMNCLIEKCNNGVFDRTFQLNWENYKNTIILTVGREVKLVKLKYLR